jgi:hypothetical protein
VNLFILKKKASPGLSFFFIRKYVGAAQYLKKKKGQKDIEWSLCT